MDSVDEQAIASSGAHLSPFTMYLDCIGLPQVFWCGNAKTSGRMKSSGTFEWSKVKVGETDAGVF